MNTLVRYTERWNSLLMQPIAGCDWLSEKDARSLYEERPGPGVMVVGGTETQAGDFLPRWVIGFGVGPGVRVQFFDEQGTLRRLIDYDGIEDRLWRWITVDYTYRDGVQRWSQRENIQKVKTSVNPDGTGWITTQEKADPRARPVVTTTEILVPVQDSYWLDRPAFGDWAALAAPGPSAWEVAGQSVPVRTS